MSIKIKLCGMFRMQDIEAVNALKPDYTGFVFFPPSHRNVTREMAARMKAALDPAIQAAGVFVDAPIEEVASLLNDGIIDIAQLHGHEDNDYIDALRRMTGKTIFRAFKIRSAEDAVKAEESHADMVLLDNGYGTGKAFDWSLIEGMKRPFILAGGLSPENVCEAIARVHPAGVDVSSGIETEKTKDAGKMRDFVQFVRAIQD